TKQSGPEISRDALGLSYETSLMLPDTNGVRYFRPDDLQLIQMFPDGLEDFERQVQAMVDGTHPRARTIGAIVEDPDYHRRLLDYVRRFRADQSTPPPVREEQTLRADPHFAAAEQIFATLPGFIGYCHTLPTGALALARRLRRLDRFPLP
ncbi:MAG: hypothetical protein ACREJT_12090, partial [Myxococcota bacterium]